MIFVDTTLASSSTTRPLCGATLKNNIKYVNNNIHNFILLPSFVLSFIHIYVLTPCLHQMWQMRNELLHMIAYEQFKRNWQDSFLTTSYLKPKNIMWKLKPILDVRDCKTCYIVYMQQRRIDIRKLVVRPISRRKRCLTSLCIYSFTMMFDN